ncbi:MAG: putative diguanylate cyclase [Euryarchaeota archaeon ADurb.Bin294]|nr:MAG: putative diguanylate cyclase [Euryarchaeota archaeon ADurb.Bin294]
MTDQISVLYVDDEPDLLDLGKIFLERIGDFRVTIATGVNEALSAMEGSEFETIISDYQMPGMDGIGFLKHLRSHGNKIPFILFTGRGREEVAIEALNNGADFYLQKGGDPSAQFAELANKVRYAVSHRRAEKQVLDLQQRESEIINFLPDATFAIDTSHVVIAWNRAMERLSGISASEIIGKGDYAYAIPFYQKKRPMLIDFVLDNDPEMMEKYPSLIRQNHTLTAEITRPWVHNGKERYFWITACPLYDMKGNVIGAIESLRDITPLKEAHALLEDTESRYRITLDASNEGIWDWNIKTGDAFFSPHWYTMLGYEPDEYPSTYKTWEMLLHPDDIEITKNRIQEHISKKEEGYTIEFRMRTKQGGWKWILARGRVIEWDEDGSPVRMVGTHADITALKRVEEKLRLDESRLEALLNLTQMTEKSMSDITHYALEEAVRLTLSKIGYVAFLSDDETVLNMHAWSNVAMEECQIRDQKKLYPLAETGLWGEPVRQRRPVITNDYAAPNPLKRGVPPGHVSLERHLGVPIVDGNRIVMLIGVANKTEPYGDEDIRQLTLLMNGVWNIIQRKRSEEALLRSNEELSAAYEEISATEEELRSQYNLISEKMEDIRESEERFRAVFNSTLVGIAITTTDGRWLYFNDALCSMLGYTAEELNQIRWTDITPAEDLVEEMKIFESVLAGKDPGNLEKRYIRKDGSIIDVLISTGIVRKQDGSIDYLCSIILDMSEKKASERLLREIEGQQRLIIENVHDPVVIVDFDGNVLYGNPAAFSICELTPGSLSSPLNIRDILSPESLEMSLADLAEIKRTGNPVINEYTIITQSGKVRTVEAAGHLIQWNGEDADLVSIRDITDRKEDKDALLQANRKLTILSSITRHDILNQVTALLGYLELLADHDLDPDIQQYIKKCLSCTTTIRSQIAFTKLVDDIRNKSLMWQYAERMITHVLEGYSIGQITCQVDLKGLYLYADPILEKVIFTLIENSIRHGENVTRIAFSYRIDDGDCIFVYEDDGSGIPDDEKENIFRQGYGKHTGLGLFLIREILAINTMTISETGAWGSGARFEIRVPAGKWVVKEGMS